MKRLLAAAFLLLLIQPALAQDRVVLVLHGGAGVRRADLSPAKEERARKVLEQALQAGHSALKGGASSLDAVETAIVVLEDAPEFNAGRGSVLNTEGAVEMDASVMNGADLKAGAVAAVTEVRNPIRLARLVMTDTPHVLLIGKGALDLAKEKSLPLEKPAWFVTPEQQQRLERAKEAKRKSAANASQSDYSFNIGTVGAVALDAGGHLAAGTSTGGMVNKRPGRVGDSPIIGAGTYAEDGVCAVSCTGHGEFFIRHVVAHDVAARIKHGKAGLREAAHAIIHEQLKPQGGTGGLIALNAQGVMSACFNTEGMFHAWITESGEAHVAIFSETSSD